MMHPPTSVRLGAYGGQVINGVQVQVWLKMELWTYLMIIPQVPKCIIRRDVFDIWQNANVGFLAYMVRPIRGKDCVESSKIALIPTTREYITISYPRGNSRIVAPLKTYRI